MFPTSKSFVYTLTRVSSKYRTELAQRFSSQGFADITPDYWIVLEWLAEEDNVSIGQLAKRTSKDNAALSRIIDGMERNDLAVRAASPSDKRSYQITMTKYARSIIGKLQEIERQALNECTEGLNPIEVKELIRMLDHIYDRMV